MYSFTVSYKCTFLCAFPFDPSLRWLRMRMWCVKAPMLATYSLLPIIQRFAKPMGVEVMRKMAGARICKPFKELRNRFLAWRAGTITLFVVPARQAT